MLAAHPAERHFVLLEDDVSFDMVGMGTLDPLSTDTLNFVELTLQGWVRLAFLLDVALWCGHRHLTV